MARLRKKNLDYEIVSLIAIKAGCRSRKEFWDWHDRSRPNNIPKHPNAYYHEWSTWGEFLNTGNTFEAAEKMNARPYWEAVRWAQAAAKENGVVSAIKWLHFYEQGKVPDDIPKRPNLYYDEWKGWRVWLGTTTEGHLTSARESIGVLAIANDSYNPSNVLNVVIERDGLVALKEELIHRQMQAVVVYEFAPEDQEKVSNVLAANGTRRQDGTYVVPNINNLLFDMDDVLDRADLSQMQ